MGLKKSTRSIYLSIVNGKLARRFKTQTPDTVIRITKEEVTVFEEYYKSVEGYIVGLDLKAPPEGKEHWGDTLLVYLNSDNERYCLQMQMNGRYAMNFLKTLPNVNLDTPVEITPSEKSLGDGKKDQTVFLRQNDIPIKRYYTRDTPHDMPEPVKKIKKKKEVWEWDEVIEFLEDNVVTPFKESLKEKALFTSELTPESQTDAGPDGDDLLD